MARSTSSLRGTRELLSADQVLAEEKEDNDCCCCLGYSKQMRAPIAARCGDQMQEWQPMATIKVEDFDAVQEAGSQ
ncbi:hypothetical protein BHM03_00051615 [Ensete ventricosum]|nr:hypothetical protein BHM03_00051615 [Ensete ventricosum]